MPVDTVSSDCPYRARHVCRHTESCAGQHFGDKEGFLKAATAWGLGLRV